MKHDTRRAVALVLGMLLWLGLGAGCGPAAPAEEKPARVAMVLTVAGLGDMNFCDMAYEGLLRSQEAFGIQFDYAEPKTVAEYESWFLRYAESGEYDLIIGLGYEQGEGILAAAEAYPETRFSIIDPVLRHSAIHAIAPRRQDQTFLCGVLAGLGTRSQMPGANEDNTIGILLGQDNPDLQNGVAGFEAGARYVNPTVEVLKVNLDTFSDPGKGKEIALAMYGRGADFIQQMAGASGLGVFNAAKETGRYAMGVGGNQNYIEPEHIVATAIRNVDELVYAEVEQMLAGQWAAGVNTPGLAEGAVGFSTAQSHVDIPPAILAAIEDIRQRICSGELVVPTTENLDDWLARHRYEKVVAA